MARCGIDVRPSTLFVIYWRLDPDRWFNEMVHKLNVVLPDLLNLDTQVIICLPFLFRFKAPLEGCSGWLFVIRIPNTK